MASRVKRKMKRIYPDGRAKASFGLGIASIVLCMVPLMLVAAVVGLMMVNESERAGFHRLQKPGKILCIIGVVLCSLVIIGIIVSAVSIGVISR